MSLDNIESGPAEAKRRRVDKGTTPVKARGSILQIMKQGLDILFHFIKTIQTEIDG